MSHQKSTNRGFTLVELLIVIVVIAILAAISIVAYNGIQNRAKTTSGQSLASQVLKKAEAYNTIRSSYPTAHNGFNHADAPEAALDNQSAVKNYVSGSGNNGVDAVATYDNGNAVVYRYCAAGTPPGSAAGGVIYYWNYTSNAAVPNSFGGGC